MEKFDIPFYPNSKDDFHCVQSCLKSVLKVYFPNKSFSFSYLDEATAHKRNKLTWDFATLLFLLKKGFDIVYISNFDYKKFSEKGEKYLRHLWRNDVYQFQKEYSNLKQEQNFAVKLSKEKRINYLKRSAKLSDLRIFFQKEYFILVAVNPFVFDGEDEYGSHMVLITNITKNFIYFHDPGLPPKPNRKTSIEKFWKAASYPDNNSVDLIAVRLKK